MSKILLVCHDIPSMTVGATLPIFHLIRILGNAHKIDLVSFDSGKYSINAFKDQINSFNTLKIPEYLSIKDQLLFTTKNMLSFDNLHTHSFLNYYYNSNMSKIIKKQAQKNNYDVAITDMPMAFYVKNLSLPKIVYAFDAVSDYNYKMYQKADNIISKIYWYLNYFKIHNYEKVYNNFNSCVVVNKKDQKLLEKDIAIPITVIPNGVDTNFFKNTKKNKPKIVFLGDMSTPPNNDAVKYFVEDIYPKILKEKDIKFYIVGRNPSSYIKSLEDDHIIVTNSVEDVRDYLEKGTIFVAPMVSGTGIKNKILEAMSMNLPVVSTSIGISGIDGEDRVNFLLADNSIDFKNAIIEIMEDAELRKNLEANGRKFVEKNYSWNESMKKLESIIDKTTTG